MSADWEYFAHVFLERNFFPLHFGLQRGIFVRQLMFSNEGPRKRAQRFVIKSLKLHLSTEHISNNKESLPLVVNARMSLKRIMILYWFDWVYVIYTYKYAGNGKFPFETMQVKNVTPRFLKLHRKYCAVH